MSTIRTILAAAAAVVFAVSSPVMAEEGHDHGKEHAHGKDEAHFKVTPPANVKEAYADHGEVERSRDGHWRQ